jgi:hypothetical protein
MAEEKKVVVKETKPKHTVAGTVRELGPQGAKDRAELAQKVVAHLARKNVTKNSKGKAITLEHVTQEVSAIIRDITNERGKNKTPQGWWSTYQVLETDTNLKILPRK